MQRRGTDRIALSVALLLALTPIAARGEYCISWSSSLQRWSGQSGHCWATEAECRSYYNSRCLNPNYRYDCAGGCNYRPGLYPPTGAAQGAKGKPAGDEAAKTAADQQKKLKEQKRKEQELEQRAFDQGVGDLRGKLKGVSPDSSSGLTLKLPPPSGDARRQLDCAARGGQQATRDLNDPSLTPEQRAALARDRADWSTGADCTPVAATVPPVPAPQRVDDEIGGNTASREALRELLEKIALTHRDLAEQDEQIRGLEQQAAREESQAKAGSPASGESDALRKAREALARAKANRERTRSELERMEQQEKAAHAPLPAATSTTGQDLRGE